MTSCLSNFLFFFLVWNESAVADVMLWKKKNGSVGMVTVTIGSWLVFETFAYTILTLLSVVLLLFLWSKSAFILNRSNPLVSVKRSLIHFWFSIPCSRPSPPLLKLWLKKPTSFYVIHLKTNCLKSRMTLQWWDWRVICQSSCSFSSHSLESSWISNTLPHR